MKSRFEDIQKQCSEVEAAFRANGLSAGVAYWLADLHGRVRQCELALVNSGLGTEQPKPEGTVYDATKGQLVCPHCGQDCGGFCEPGDKRHDEGTAE